MIFFSLFETDFDNDPCWSFLGRCEATSDSKIG